ncbi:MAG: Hsp20/alpha crystallin family protein [Bacteroidota bacterium]
MTTERIFPTINKLIDNILNEDFFHIPSTNLQWAATLPAVNIRESDQAFTLEVAAPGLSKEAFDLQVEEQVLTISAKSEGEHTNKANYIRKGFNYQNFKRSFRLPKGIDTAAINAKYEQGVLFIEIPKVTEAKSKTKITIE